MRPGLKKVPNEFRMSKDRLFFGKVDFGKSMEDYTNTTLYTDQFH